MNGYLIAEEGPLAGFTIAFEEAEGDNQWSLGRDPETSDIVLEDPMVSRQHAIVRATPEGLFFESLSSVNPATQNGMVIAEPVLLKEGDIIQIGSTFFRFTENAPEEKEEIEEAEAQEPGVETGGATMPSELHFGPSPDTRWLLKVISGPNAGAEFAMHKSSTYLLGKDPNMCDVVFQDLSVSRQHARLTIDGDENVFIEDLGSRNGVIVNGELIDEKHLLSTQDLVALGTTTFLVVDRVEPRETILSPPAAHPKIPSPVKEKETHLEEKEKKDWKELIIPKKHLVGAGIFGAVLFVSIFGMLSLFKAQPIAVHLVDEGERIREALEKFPAVQFSFNAPSGKLFLTGHVLTTVDHQELLYVIKGLPFIGKVEDNVIVDELVWQSMNALLSRNPNWVGVSVYGPEAGRFVLRGYVPTLEVAESLNDYVNLNFDYLDKLESEVVIESNLQIQIESLLAERGFSAVTFELSNGEIVFSGRVDEKEKRPLGMLLSDLKEIPGIRTIKNYIVVTAGDTSRVDLSTDYRITGYSKRDDKDYYVVINGRILGQGDMVDGMMITKIDPKIVFLEKEGVKYRINYNLQ